jgi:cell division protein FtsB
MNEQKFFRIGFFICLILFLASAGFTLYTRFTPTSDKAVELQSEVDNLNEKIVSLNQTIDNLKQENKDQLEDVNRLSENNQKQSEIIGQVNDILSSTYLNLSNAKSANDQVRIYLLSIKEIAAKIKETQK